MLPGLVLAACLSGIPFCTAAIAKDIVTSLSFGQGDKISPNGRAVPGWHLSGEGHTPQILSDRIVLTPPAPGHARGALWADTVNAETQWSAETSFRAGGSDRGTGNFQIWYVKGGNSVVGSNSVYTVGKFDGLVLTVDQHGGNGGMLRGFLNDGSTNYKDHQMVDSLAFAHCNFHYRNLGRSSTVKVTHDKRGLEVRIDGEPCFSSEKIALPAGYHFGMTAATSDDPDSFEVNSFVFHKTIETPSGHFQSSQPPQQVGRSQSSVKEPAHMPNAPEQIADAEAASIKKQEEQFADLHNRLQGLSHQVNNLFKEFDRVVRTVNDRNAEILSKIPKSSDEGIAELSRRLGSIERSLGKIESEVAGRDYSTHLDDLHKAVEGVKGGLSEALPDTLHKIVKGSSPKITTFVLAIVAVQIMLAGIYFVYKRRRDGAPKKYL